MCDLIARIHDSHIATLLHVCGSRRFADIMRECIAHLQARSDRENNACVSDQCTFRNICAILSHPALFALRPSHVCMCVHISGQLSSKLPKLNQPVCNPPCLSLPAHGAVPWPLMPPLARRISALPSASCTRLSRRETRAEEAADANKCDIVDADGALSNSRPGHACGALHRWCIPIWIRLEIEEQGKATNGSATNGREQ